ncbi:hypothetical protein JB92DRAFT_2831869 [Gautieria morchelliformis]|nr:hypothetical protein JB92DRAFT_2831869 [Gautieria morchelliformis]
MAALMAASLAARMASFVATRDRGSAGSAAERLGCCWAGGVAAAAAVEDTALIAAAVAIATELGGGAGAGFCVGGSWDWGLGLLLVPAVVWGCCMIGGVGGGVSPEV